MDKELFSSIEENNSKRIKELISKKVNVNIVNDYGWTPLHMASKKGDTEIVKLLLEHGADVNAKDYRKRSPLHMASEYGHIEIVKLLLEHGAEVDIKNDAEATPLHFASGDGYTEIVKLLLEHGADIHAKNRNGDTPLHDALSESRIETVKLLLEKGANVNVKNENGDSALDIMEFSEGEIYKLFDKLDINNTINKSENITDDYSDGVTILNRKKYIQNILNTILDITSDLHSMFDIFSLSVYIFDKYTSLKNIPSNKLDLVCLTAVLIAGKFTEIDSSYILYRSRQEFNVTKEEIIDRESKILITLNYKLMVSHIDDFGDRGYIKFLTEYMTFYIENKIFTKYDPSIDYTQNSVYKVISSYMHANYN